MNGVQNFEQIISGDYGHLVSGDNGVSVWANYPGFIIYYPNISNSNSSLSLNFPGDDIYGLHLYHLILNHSKAWR